MSNIYITEPNTEGKVLLHTSFGDLDVELWPQQAPKACRNFVQLCLEGYYDQTIFHRIITGFMVQGGDPTGTGKGGESIYGGAFIDEFHSRLKFNHRGLLAMANENKPNTNHSQFFFTLDACDFLDKKHTIFGKVTGNTIFNLLSVGNLETDAQDRPTNPPKMLGAEVLWNPFEDIVPRAVKRKEATTEESAQKKKKRERKSTKDLKLLSFGDEEEAFQEEIGAKRSNKKKAKMMSSHDLLDDRKLKAEVDAEVLQRATEASGETTSEEKKERSRANLKAAVVAASAASKQAQSADVSNEQSEDTDKKPSLTKGDKFTTDPGSKRKDREEYAKLREELRKSKKAVPLLMGEEAKNLEKDRAFQDMLTPLQQQRQNYLQRKKSTNRSAREQDTLSKLKKFQATLFDVNMKKSSPGADAKSEEDVDKTKKESDESYHGQILEDDDGDDDTNDDKSWMTAKLKFKKHIDDQFRAGNEPSTDDYLTIDSRNEKTQRSRDDSRRSGERGRRDRSKDRSRDSARHSRHRDGRRDRRSEDRHHHRR
ncbi:Peptidyl-prolyl isomerase cwc27 [Phytophthora pseudosyringae]|uniref:Peptidyl-prolyl isomerase cwc27 n=1 Tax=Phytophthora pseudosyringae TaxID=221518 RepID=A0A8T1VKB8_9STRA|nr:Peptidyl-prolyl isomerase cwc27 [Phytophthora pseudosyringae]